MSTHPDGPVAAYLAHLAAGSTAPSTLRAVTGTLARLTAWAAPRPVHALTAADLGRWREHQRGEQGLGRRTVNVQWSHIRGFYRWALAGRVVTADPTDGLVPRGRTVGPEGRVRDRRQSAQQWVVTGPIRQYLDHLHLCGRSPDTLKTVRSILSSAERIMGVPLLQADEDDVTAWQAARAEDLTVASRRTQQNYLRGFYAWTVRTRLTGTDPTIMLDSPRVPSRLPRPIGEDRLWRAIEDAPTHQLQVMLLLAACAGLRACEVSGLTWADVDLDAGIVRVLGKGGKERALPLVDPLPGALRALGPRRSGPVIARLDGRPGHVAPVRISQMTNLYLRAIGCRDSYHALRHRFATRVYAASKDLRATQEALGHASPVTTTVYTLLDADALRGAVLGAGRGA